jgi:hypothetical protein
MDTDIIDYIRGNREPIAIIEAAEELSQLGNLGAAWPRATPEHWTRELQRLVDAGKLLECNGILSVPKAEQMKQGELF